MSKIQRNKANTLTQRTAIKHVAVHLLLVFTNAWGSQVAIGVLVTHAVPPLPATAACDSAGSPRGPRLPVSRDCGGGQRSNSEMITIVKNYG